MVMKASIVTPFLILHKNSVLSIGHRKREQMTIEQAIDLLDNLIGMIDDNHGNDYDTALKMAIKALEESVSK